MGEFESEKRNQLLWLRNLYKAYVDNSFELMWRSTLDDKIDFCNRVFVQTLGFTTHKKAKATVLDSLMDSPEQYMALKEKIILEKEVHQQKVYLKRRDQRPMVALVNAKLMIDEKNEFTISWTGIDISDRIEQERTLEVKNKQLAKVNTQMEHFLYSTSHDLRSPLTTIMGLTHLLRFESMDRNVLEYISKIEDCTGKLDKIIKDIVSFSKMTYKNVHTRKIDFRKLINAIVKEHSHKETGRQPEVEISITGNLPFYSDHDRVKIILDNIIRNAFQFRDKNKVMPFIHIKITTTALEVVIDIHDNGVGIAEKYLNHVFKMFFKASILSKGAGLGLYIAREGVEQLGGTIEVRSEQGFGTAFKVTLPNTTKSRLIKRKLIR